MKITNLHRTILLAGVLVLGSIFFACTSSAPQTGKAQTPTAAYEQLFKAVKAKNTAEIKKVLSKGTVSFSQTVSGQYNKSEAEVLANGFTQTTFSDKLPAMRDERIAGNYAAVEVFSTKSSQWEDVPFVLEDGGWKLAIGDQFGGSFKSPGPSRTTREKLNANAAGKGDMVPYSNSNVNTNGDATLIVPKESKGPGNAPNPNAPK